MYRRRLALILAGLLAHSGCRPPPIVQTDPTPGCREDLSLECITPVAFGFRGDGDVARAATELTARFSALHAAPRGLTDLLTALGGARLLGAGGPLLVLETPAGSASASDCAAVVAAGGSPARCVRYAPPVALDPTMREGLALFASLATDADAVVWIHPQGATALALTPMLRSWGGPDHILEAPPPGAPLDVTLRDYAQLVRRWRDLEVDPMNKPEPVDEPRGLGPIASDWAAALPRPDDDTVRFQIPAAAVAAAIIARFGGGSGHVVPDAPETPWTRANALIAAEHVADPEVGYCRAPTSKRKVDEWLAAAAAIEPHNPAIAALLRLDAARNTREPLSASAHVMHALDLLDKPAARWWRFSGARILLNPNFIRDSRVSGAAEELVLAALADRLQRETDPVRRADLVAKWHRILSVDYLMSSTGLTGVSKLAISDLKSQERVAEKIILGPLGGKNWQIWAVLPVYAPVLRAAARAAAETLAELTPDMYDTPKDGPDGERRRSIRAMARILDTISLAAAYFPDVATKQMELALAELGGNDRLLERWRTSEADTLDSVLLLAAFLARAGLVEYAVRAGDTSRLRAEARDLVLLLQAALPDLLGDPQLVAALRRAGPQIFQVVDAAAQLAITWSTKGDLRRDNDALVAALARLDFPSPAAGNVGAYGWALAAEVLVDDILLLWQRRDLGARLRTILLREARTKARYLADHWDFQDNRGRSIGTILLAIQEVVEQQSARPRPDDVIDGLFTTFEDFLASPNFRTIIDVAVRELRREYPQSRLDSRLRSQDDPFDVVLALLFKTLERLPTAPSFDTVVETVVEGSLPAFVLDMKARGWPANKSRTAVALLYATIDAPAAIELGRAWNQQSHLLRNELVWDLLAFTKAFTEGRHTEAAAALVHAEKECPGASDLIHIRRAMLALTRGASVEAIIHLQRRLDPRKQHRGEVVYEYTQDSAVVNFFYQFDSESGAVKIGPSWKPSFKLGPQGGEVKKPPLTIQDHPAASSQPIYALALTVVAHLGVNNDRAIDRTLGLLVDALEVESKEQFRLRIEHDKDGTLHAVLATAATWAAARAHTQLATLVMQNVAAGLAAGGTLGSFPAIRKAGLARFIELRAKDVLGVARAPEDEIEAALRGAVAEGSLPSWSVPLLRIQNGHSAPAKLGDFFPTAEALLHAVDRGEVHTALAFRRPCETLLRLSEGSMAITDENAYAEFARECPSDLVRSEHLRMTAYRLSDGGAPSALRVRDAWRFGPLRDPSVAIPADFLGHAPAVLLDATRDVLRSGASGAPVAARLAELHAEGGHMAKWGEFSALALALECPAGPGRFTALLRTMRAIKLDATPAVAFVEQGVATRDAKARSAACQEYAAKVLARVVPDKK